MDDDREPDPSHASAGSYVRVRAGRQVPSALACHLHQHLVATCPECRRHWLTLAASQERVYEALRPVRAAPEAASPGGRRAAASAFDPSALPAVSPQAAHNLEKLERYRRRKKGAIRDFWELRRTPIHRRQPLVRFARVRYSSRMLAERLLQASRDAVRSEPAEAESFAALVPYVLRRIPGAAGTAWAAGLLVRAAGHCANALRVQGDLPAAARAFILTRCTLAELGVRDPRVLAEVASLEASLAIGQRRLAEAEELLDRAALLYRQAGDEEGSTRVLIKQGQLLQLSGRFDDAITHLEAAARDLDPTREPYLYLGTVTARVACLCELGTPREAGLLLRQHEEHFTAGAEPHLGAVYRDLQGRVAFSLSHFDAAARAFADSRDGLLALGRGHDAALAALDLAQVYLAAGDLARLEGLAGQLVRQFKARQVPAETLAALRLLAQAITGRSLTAELLAGLRRRAEAGRGPLLVGD